MSITDTSLYRERADILAEMLSQLAAAISDAYIGEDGNWYITFEIQAGQLENLYLANQILLEDSFVQTASYNGLLRHGEQYSIFPKEGTISTGTLRFEGTGSTYVPVGTEAAYDPGGGLDPIEFVATTDGTIPNPGVPAPSTAAVNVSAGPLNGLYEYVVTFVTGVGETLPSTISNPISPVNQLGALTGIPVGGAGTTARRIYRRKNGAGDFRRIWELSDNTTTGFGDGASDAAAASGALAPIVDTAHQITVAAQSVEPGAENNVAVGTITVLTEASESLTAVTNTVAFTGGSDPEDTEDYRNRILQYLQNPQTGSVSDLQALAESVPGVDNATVFPNTPSPGSVTVRISGPGGTIPSAQVQADVLHTLQAFDIANITIVVDVFTALPTNVTVDVTTSGSYTLADVTPAVQKAISDYINSLGVGVTLRIAGVVDAVFGLAGIDDVVVTTPSSNQTTPATQKRTPGTISVV